MLKATERMHTRNRMVQIGPTCSGQQLIACYRNLRDEETGCSFCMMMRCSDFKSIKFNVQATDELLHLWFEDNECDWNREKYLEEHGNIVLEQSVTASPIYKRVYLQLLNAIRKELSKDGYLVNEDLSVTMH